MYFLTLVFFRIFNSLISLSVRPTQLFFSKDDFLKLLFTLLFITNKIYLYVFRKTLYSLMSGVLIEKKLLQYVYFYESYKQSKLDWALHTLLKVS